MGTLQAAVSDRYKLRVGAGLRSFVFVLPICTRDACCGSSPQPNSETSASDRSDGVSARLAPRTCGRCCGSLTLVLGHMYQGRGLVWVICGAFGRVSGAGSLRRRTGTPDAASK